MLTTIIVICYDWIQFLPDSLTEISKQTVPIKKIVLTDGSTPAIAEYVSKQPDITLITHSSINKIERVNVAVKAVETPYYLLLGVDDFLDVNYIKEAEEILTDSKIDIVHPDIQKFGNVNERWDSVGLISTIRNWNSMFFSSVVKKSLFTELGGYDENIPYCMNEDWDFWVRAYFANAKAYHLAKPYFKYRIHDKQFTQTTVQQHVHEIMGYLVNKWRAYG